MSDQIILEASTLTVIAETEFGDVIVERAAPDLALLISDAFPGENGAPGAPGIDGQPGPPGPPGTGLEPGVIFDGGNF